MIERIEQSTDLNCLKAHTRSKTIARNVIGLFASRVVIILANLLLVPLTLRYLNVEGYGIWLTINSIVSWIRFFDIGLGNGLRNKFGEAIAMGDTAGARRYVSTSYVTVAGILLMFLSMLLLISPFLDWSTLLNAPESMNSEIKHTIICLAGFLCLRFTFGLVGAILMADQRPAMSAILEAVASLTNLAGVIILTLVSESSIFLLGVLSGLTSVLVFLIASWFFFTNRYKEVRPSLSFFHWVEVRALTRLSLQFFVIQVAVLIVFSSSNIVISHLYGAYDVAVFNIPLKYFSIVTVVFGIIVTPYWSATTEAFKRGEMEWIRTSNKKLLGIWFFMAIVTIVMLLSSDWAYSLWVGESIHVPENLSLYMSLFVLISAWNNIYVYFLNGMSKIRLQLVCSVIPGLVAVPLQVVFAREFGFGLAGVALGLGVSLLPTAVLMPLQLSLIISGKAKGIFAG